MSSRRERAPRDTARDNTTFWWPDWLRQTTIRALVRLMIERVLEKNSHGLRATGSAHPAYGRLGDIRRNRPQRQQRVEFVQFHDSSQPSVQCAEQNFIPFFPIVPLTNSDIFRWDSFLMVPSFQDIPYSSRDRRSRRENDLIKSAPRGFALARSGRRKVVMMDAMERQLGRHS